LIIDKNRRKDSKKILITNYIVNGTKTKRGRLRTI